MKSIVAIFMLFLASGLVINPLNSEPVKKNTVQFPILPCELHTGDLVFRRGRGLISDFFSNASEHDKRFSHVGVVVEKHGMFYVFHIIGSGHTDTKGLKTEPLHSFCDATQNSAFALYRNSNLEGKQKAVLTYLEGIKEQGIIFDEHFNLQTDEAQYCTEMIYKMIVSVTGKKLPLSKFEGEQYVSVDNLFHNLPECKLIFNHIYPQSQ